MPDPVSQELCRLLTRIEHLEVILNGNVEIEIKNEELGYKGEDSKENLKIYNMDNFEE
jgi:hypothetical protein